MKLLLPISIALVATFILNNNVNAQAFQKGTINIDLGIGFGIYGTSQSSTNELSYTAFGLPITQKTTHDTTDGAVSTVVPISFEYGVADKIGLGLDITYNSYFINDSDRVNLNSVRAYDFGPKVSFHPLNSDFYDLSAGLGLGFSTISWNVTGLNNSENYSGSGFYINLDIKNKFWFSEHVGAYLNVGYKGNFYGNINRDTSSQEAAFEAIPGVSDVTVKDEFKWTMHGANIGIGLALKF